MIDHDDLLFDATALCWICDGIIELRLTLYQVGWAVNRFDEVRSWHRPAAEEALRRLAE